MEQSVKNNNCIAKIVEFSKDLVGLLAETWPRRRSTREILAWPIRLLDDRSTCPDEQLVLLCGRLF